MTVSERYSEEEYENVRQNLVKDEIANVEKILQRVPHEGLENQHKNSLRKIGI